MFTISKSLIVAAAALVSTAAASAETQEKINFSYDKNASVEQNYAAFARTAKRACSDVSALQGYKGQRACRRELLDQAVSATKQGTLIAHHQQATDAVQSFASLRGQ